MPIKNIPEYSGAGVYALIGSDGRYYIGSSKNVNQRLKTHLSCMRRSIKNGHDAFVSSKLEDALHKGITFDCKLLATFGEELSKSELEEIERIFIRKHVNSYNTKPIRHKV